MSGDVSPEAMASALEESGQYRVLRRVPAVQIAADPDPDKRIGIILDVETTGLDPATCTVIELAMVAFEYDDEGVGRALRVFSGLHEPTEPLPDDIARLTGLTAADLTGQRIDDAKVEAFVVGAGLVIAHNAEFDRRFAERRWPVFERRAWGCSLSQVPWRDHGMTSSGLKALLADAGLFHNGHRALDDCLATLHLLGVPLPGGGRTPFAHILERSRAPSLRVWAIGAPFEVKDALKQRGYRWSDGSSGMPKAWHIEIAEADLEAEKAFLEREVYRGPSRATLVPVTARDRFSDRAGRASRGDQS